MLRWNGGEVGHGFENTGEVTTAIRSRLLDLQYGRAEDPYGWLHRVC
jgi:branched-chain amino acid aminotransferase